jgi:hypothetical protein
MVYVASNWWAVDRINWFIGSSPVVTTNNYYTIADLHSLQSLHTNLLSLFPLVFTIRFLAQIYNTFTVKRSSNHTLILLPIYDDSVLKFNLQSDLNPRYRLSLYRHGKDHAENTVLLLRNLTTGHREPSSHCCLLDCLQNCCLATNRNIRYNNGLPIVIMQY